MGLENAVFQIEGGAGLGLTYVTGALVKVGQLAGRRADRRRALRLGCRTCCCGRRWSRAPLCGALAYHWINLAAIWFAAGCRAGA